MTEHGKDPFDPTGALKGIEHHFSNRSDHQPGGSGLIAIPTLEAFNVMRQEHAAAKRQADAVRSAELKAKQRHSRMSRWKKIGVAITSLALSYGTVTPGDGVIDRVGAATSTASERIGPIVDSIIDTEVSSKQDVAAANRVAEVYKVVDKQGMDTVIEQVAAYREAHKGEFGAYFRRDEYKNLIEAASTTTEFEDALGIFLENYDVSLLPIDKTSDLDEVKEVGVSFVDVLAPLPRSFITQNLSIKKVNIVEEIEDDTIGRMSSDSMMSIRLTDSLKDQMKKQADGILSEPFSYQNTIAHELIHAINYAHPGKLSSYVLYPGDKDNTSYANWRILKGLVNKPEVPSTYSLTNEDEFAAEVGAGLLASGTNDLPSPAEHRRFTAKLTEHQLRFLTALEKISPGISRLLVADRAQD